MRFDNNNKNNKTKETETIRTVMKPLKLKKQKISDEEYNKIAEEKLEEIDRINSTIDYFTEYKDFETLEEIFDKLSDLASKCYNIMNRLSKEWD